MPKPRDQMTPSFATAAGAVFAFLAVLTAIAGVWLALSDASAHDRLERFDAAPVCVAPTPPGSACKTELAAQIESALIGGGKNPIATLTLRTSLGTAVLADVQADRSPDSGEAADVVLWQGKCIIVRTDGEGAIPTYDNPAWTQKNDAAGLLAMLGFTVAFESLSAVFLTWFVVNREKMPAAILLAAVPFVVTIGLRMAHFYGAVVVASFAMPLLILGLYLAWPHLAWAREHSPLRQWQD